MSLPKINAAKLQQTVAELEFSRNFDSFDELANAVAETQWADQFDLDANTLVKLMVKHKTITKVAKPENMSEVATFATGGRGRKECPACHTFVGARSQVCHCGHAFQKDQKPVATASLASPKEEVQVQRAVVQAKVQGFNLTIDTPSGACPVSLNSTLESDVVNWAEKVRRNFADERNAYLTANGLRYYVRQFFPYATDEYNDVCELIA